MKRFWALLGILLLICAFSACAEPAQGADIAATTLPVYEFTSRLCQGTDLTVTRLVTENVSCLHDYALNVSQVRAIEAADVVVLSGAGLEEFMEDLLDSAEATIDSASGIDIIHCEDDHEHEHEHAEDHGHSHEDDPHIWLSPANAKIMAQNICQGLCAEYPEYAEIFSSNLTSLQAELDKLLDYGEEALSGLSCRELITFHDGFAYLAQAFDLTILEAVEEESGSEASAEELIHLIEIVEHHGLTAIFTETNGSSSAAQIIAAETGADLYTLDMAMAGDSYFDAMYRNIETIKEALQ